MTTSRPRSGPEVEKSRVFSREIMRVVEVRTSAGDLKRLFLKFLNDGWLVVEVEISELLNTLLLVMK